MAGQIDMFGGAIPENYDRHLGKLFFDSYAADLAARIPPDANHLLEIACGTGRLTAHLAARSSTASIVATDLSEPMLAHARKHHADLMNVEWRTADGMALPFADASFNAIACQFGLMFFPDKSTGLSEALRVLKPGGRFTFNIWHSVEANPIVSVVSAVVHEFANPQAAGFLNVPHGFGDPAMWLDLLAATGFEDPSCAEVLLPVNPIPAADAATGFLYGTPMFNVLSAHDPATIGPVHVRLSEEFAKEFGDPVHALMSAFVVAGTRPSS